MRVLSFLRSIFDDLLILAGCVVILIGVYQIFIPAAWILGGVMLIVFGVLLAGIGGNGDR